MIAGGPARLVVVSPHLDDAVLSLGAFIRRTAESEARITVLTVFAGNPDSRAPAGGWDRRGGFATEGEAATARRLEDSEACELLGAEPAWLSFSEADYRESLDEDAVWSAVCAAVSASGAEAVLVPGFPLANPDHAFVSGLFASREAPCGRMGLYAEQPYRYVVRKELSIPQPPGQGSSWTRLGIRPREVLMKRRAILAYRSQMPLLGFSRSRYRKLNRMLLHEVLRRGEAILWLTSSSSQATP